jgi:autotransporter-associated beta strand protein
MNIKKVLRLAYVAALLATQSVYAATYYWDGTSASWNTAANWSTASGATTPDPATVPSALDDAIFNITTANGAEAVTLDADQSVGAMTFNNTGTTTLTGGGTDRTLTLGMGGITIASGAGAVTLGDGTAGNNVLLSLTTGAQTWLNNSAVAFTLTNTVSTFTRATGATLTFNKASTGNFAISTTVLPHTNSISGPWAFFGTGTSQKYAKITSGNIAGLTGTPVTNVNGMNDATANYEYNATTTITAGGTLAANTLRTSITNRISLSNSSGFYYALTLNGILAVDDSGPFRIARGSDSTKTVGLTIGNMGELVIAGQQEIIISSPIFGGTVSGSRLIYSGTKTLTLSGARPSTYTGGTTINSGTIILGTGGTLGMGGPLTLSGGSLNLGTTSQTVGAVSVIAAAASGDTIGNGNLTGTSYAASNASGDAIISASLLANSTAGFTKSGTGTVTFSGTNTYIGTTTISAGTLVLATNNALSAATAVSLGAGTLDAQSYSNAVNMLEVTGAATINIGTDGKLVFADSSSLNSSWTGTLTITGDFIPGSSVRFGESRSALTLEQLSKISWSGSGVVLLDSNGFLNYRRGTLITFF